MRSEERKFKRTGIGLIPENWEEKKVGEFVDIKHGYGFKGEFFTEEPNENIVLTPGNFHIGGGFKSEKFKYTVENYPDEYVLKEGDIIVTMTDLSKEGDTLGYSAKIPAPNDMVYLHNQRLGLLKFKSRAILPDFLHWVLRTKNYNLFVVGSATGSTVKHTSPDRIKQFSFGLPLMAEQSKIASFLTALDSKIELNQRINKTLEAVGQAIFKRWFVDFEFPNEEGKPYKSSGGEMIYNEELDKEIPEGWKVKPIDEIADFLNGLALQKFPAADGEEYLPVIKIRELRQGITESSDKANLDLPKEYIVNDGDVLFSWSGSLEVVIWGYGKGALNQHLFKATSSKYPKWFFYHWILHYLPEYRQIAADKATTMGHIQRHHLTASQVIVPDDKTLERMNKLLVPILERISGIKVETKVLSEIRDLLLPKLMSGKIRVPLENQEAI